MALALSPRFLGIEATYKNRYVSEGKIVTSYALMKEIYVNFYLFKKKERKAINYKLSLLSSYLTIRPRSSYQITYLFFFTISLSLSASIAGHCSSIFRCCFLHQQATCIGHRASQAASEALLKVSATIDSRPS